MADLSSIAHKATKKAKNAETHQAAATAHDRASKLAFADGDFEKAKKHAQQAEEHRLQSNSDSSSTESNPLLAWTKAKV